MVTEVQVFHLIREEDVTGISGIGHIATGVVLPSGRVVLEWHTAHKSLGIYDNVGEVRAIHGHDGKTKLEYQTVYEEQSFAYARVAMETVEETEERLALDHNFRVETGPGDIDYQQPEWKNNILIESAPEDPDRDPGDGLSDKYRFPIGALVRATDGTVGKVVEERADGYTDRADKRHVCWMYKLDVDAPGTPRIIYAGFMLEPIHSGIVDGGDS